METFDKAHLGVEVYAVYIILTHSIGLWNGLVYGFHRNFYVGNEKGQDEGLYRSMVEEDDNDSLDNSLLRAKADDF